MEPPEPTQPGTSLELPSEPGPGRHPAPSTSTDLELTPAAPPSALDETGPPQPSEPAAPGLLGNAVIARFKQVETAMLGRVLISALSDALPASMIRLERRRSFALRRAQRKDEPIGITITADDRTLSLRAPEDGVTEASVGHTVRGVVLSTRAVPVSQWLDELAELLDHVFSDDDVTRAALERALLS